MKKDASRPASNCRRSGRCSRRLGIVSLALLLDVLVNFQAGVDQADDDDHVKREQEDVTDELGELAVGFEDEVQAAEQDKEGDAESCPVDLVALLLVLELLGLVLLLEDVALVGDERSDDGRDDQDED